MESNGVELEHLVWCHGGSVDKAVTMQQLNSQMLPEVRTGHLGCTFGSSSSRTTNTAKPLFPILQVL